MAIEVLKAKARLDRAPNVTSPRRMSERPDPVSRCREVEQIAVSGRGRNPGSEIG